MGEGLTEKKDALTAESPYNDAGFQLFHPPKCIFIYAEGENREHFFLNPEE
jgi:hypothetical protein